MSDNNAIDQSSESESTDKSKLKIKEKTNTYMKYSSWGYTLFGLMLVAIVVGQYADGYFEFEKPMITLSLLLIVIVSKFYTLIKDLA